MRVVNKRTYVPEPGDIPFYVGRGSLLGNYEGSSRPNRYDVPRMGRTESIAAFGRKFMQRVADGDPEILDALQDIAAAGDRAVLVCYCKPKACHAEIIAAVVRRLTHSE